MKELRIKKFIFTLSLLGSFVLSSKAQIVDPVDLSYRGRESQIARGVMDGNLIESNYRNHGEYSRYRDTPFGVYPRGTGNRHVDGIGFYVVGRVWANRLGYPTYFPGATTDTLIAQAEHNYRSDAGGVLNPKGPIWGWLPLPGFHKDNRINPVTLQREPQPATSTDPSTWPDFWPDKLDNPDDPGWSSEWNGYFGKGIFQADYEAYYVMDDHTNAEYGLDRGVPNSPSVGVFYPNPQDSTVQGLGLMIKVRILQWANILAEDAAFMLYEIVNRGGYDHGARDGEGLYFSKIIDYGMGDETDGVAEFDPRDDVAFAFDQSGDGPDATGRIYPIAVSGFAFLESPALPENGLDDDEDGITDEQRNGGAGILIQGQAAIRAYAEANYNMSDFNTWQNGTATGPLENRPAYQAGYWWTGDENMNWLAYEDENGNGQYDPGEFQNDDVGRDGIGSFEYTYKGPDQGEADGIPTIGEPNFDRLDIDESDQIGLRGFDQDPRPIYQAGDNLRNDRWLWDRIENEAIFPLGTPRASIIAGVEPFMMFVSGPVDLNPESSDFFSLAWLFGADRLDFYRNLAVVKRIYNANYRFAEAPIMPTITAIAGDGRVIVAWDTVSTISFDKFSRKNDFEGYRLYRGTDPLLSDIRTISDVDGTPTFYKPMVQYDLANGITGPVPVQENRASFNLGEDTGLKFFHIDSTVTNGVTYYYVISAYDHGVIDTLDGGIIKVDIDPQENVFNFRFNAFQQVLNTSRNAAAVTPKAKAAGYVEGTSNEDLSKITSGYGTGSAEVTIVDPAQVDYDAVYELSFRDSVINSNPFDYITYGYTLTRKDQNRVLSSGLLEPTTPYIEGFFVSIYNDENISFDADRTGWVGNAGQENEIINANASLVDGYDTNLEVMVDYPGEAAQGWRYTPDNFELRFFDQNVYYPPRFQTSVYLRDSLKMMAYNIDKLDDNGNPTPVQILVVDVNDDDEFNYDTDELFITEQIGSARFPRQRVRFRLTSGSTVVEPKAGDVIRISNKRPFRTGDFFTFTIGEPSFDAEMAKSELDKIKVVPNPYIGTNVLEVKTATQTGLARAERRIMFNHLPAQCTITIYNVRGEVIRRIERNAASNNGTEYWDLLNKDNQDVAYGVYIFHVNAPGIGEKIGKFALIK